MRHSCTGKHTVLARVECQCTYHQHSNITLGQIISTHKMTRCSQSHPNTFLSVQKMSQFLFLQRQTRIIMVGGSRGFRRFWVQVQGLICLSPNFFGLKCALLFPPPPFFLLFIKEIKGYNLGLAEGFCCTKSNWEGGGGGGGGGGGFLDFVLLNPYLLFSLNPRWSLPRTIGVVVVVVVVAGGINPFECDWLWAGPPPLLLLLLLLAELRWGGIRRLSTLCLSHSLTRRERRTD